MGNKFYTCYLTASTLICRALRWGYSRYFHNCYRLLFFSILGSPMHKPHCCAHITQSLHHVPWFQHVLSVDMFLHPCYPYLEGYLCIYRYMYTCVNFLLYMSAFILSPTLLLSFSKGRHKYLSEVICCRQAYCLQGIRMPFWGASILCYWLISCILFGAQGLKA